MPTTINNRESGLLFPPTQFLTINNPVNTYTVYERYRAFAMALLDTTSPELYYRTTYNAPNSFNGEGVHEKFIFRGKSVLDLSMGNLDFPWFVADVYAFNEKSIDQLLAIANAEADLVVAPKLRSIVNFIYTLPPYTRVYYYEGMDGSKAITISDEFNGVKFNYDLTYNPLGDLLSINF